LAWGDNLGFSTVSESEALFNVLRQSADPDCVAAIERAVAARGKAPQDATLAEMDALWDEAKARE